MNAPAAITASLVDVRNLNTEKSVKLTLHVPAELAEAVFAAFGWPTATNPVPVALARLVSPAEPIAKPETTTERRPFSEIPYAQQAAMRCNEPGFQTFVRADSAEGAANRVRAACEVASRSDIIKDTPAGARWEAIEAEFYAWLRDLR